MKNFLKNTLLTLGLLTLIAIPALGIAQGLVPCGTESYPEGHEKEYQIKNPCGFNEVFDLINNVINFLFTVVALPLAAIMFAYAGFLFMFSGMQPEARSKAKRIFWQVAFGFVLALAAWLIVHTILEILGHDGSWIGF